MNKRLTITLITMILTFIPISANAAQNGGDLPPTCDYERWWDPNICVNLDGTPYPWTYSIKAECLQIVMYDRKAVMKDPVCRKALRHVKWHAKKF